MYYLFYLFDLSDYTVCLRSSYPFYTVIYYVLDIIKLILIAPIFINQNVCHLPTIQRWNVYICSSGPDPNNVAGMVTLLDGNSKHAAHLEGRWDFSERVFKCVTALDLDKCLNRLNYRFYFTRAHLFLSYHLL